MNSPKIIRVTQIIFIISLLAYFGLGYLVRLHFFRDEEGVSLLIGMTFGNLLMLSAIVFVVAAIIYFKRINKIDKAFLFLIVVGIISFIAYSSIMLQRSVKNMDKQLEVLNNLRQDVTVTATVDGKSYDTIINYLPLDELIKMMRENAGIQTDSTITSETFQGVVQSGKQIGLNLISFNYLTSNEKAIAAIDTAGYRPANINEFISFVWTYRNSLKNVVVTSYSPSRKMIGGGYKIAVFKWNNNVPTITLRDVSREQESNEFSLVVKK